MSTERECWAEDLVDDSGFVDTCMALRVDMDSKTVTLYLDTGCNEFLDWIRGEGADIGLLRDQKSGRVVGVNLPLMCERLAVFHDGPLQINGMFTKD